MATPFVEENFERDFEVIEVPPNSNRDTAGTVGDTETVANNVTVSCIDVYSGIK